MLQRRDFLMLMGATGVLAGCVGGPPKSSKVTVKARAGAGMNTAEDGSERSVTLLIVRLKDVGKFNSADIFSLQSDPASVLGGDLVGSDQLTVGPGATASKTIGVPPEAGFLGVVAFLRVPNGRTWRRSVAIKAESTVTANVVLGKGGLSLSLS